MSASSDPDPRHTGTFLGVPYDWRRPTVARLRERWWNPDDRRVFTPKPFGWGYDIQAETTVDQHRLGMTSTTFGIQPPASLTVRARLRATLSSDHCVDSSSTATCSATRTYHTGPQR